MIGVDNMTSVPIGCKVPVTSVENQSISALSPDAVIDAAAYIWIFEKIIPSIIKLMSNFPN